MKLTAPQIAGYAAGAGFPSGQIPTAIAIALAESGGDTEARGDVALQTTTWGPSVGLWQIRSLKPAALAKASGADSYRDAAKLTDPVFNAAAARAIYAERGWAPWSTYPGAYLLHLPRAKAAAQSPAPVGGGAAAPAGGGTVQPVGLVDDLGKLLLPGTVVLDALGVDSVQDMLGAAKQGVGLLGNLVAFIAKAAAWMADPGNWLRVLKVWVGSWLVVLGLALTAWPAASKVAGVAANVVPAGRAAKAAGAARSFKAPAPAPAAA